jgi:hypothetical protein
VARRWWPVVVVVLVIAGMTAGARAVADTLAGPPEPVTGFAGIVEVAPGPGWVLDSREDTGIVDRLVLAKGAVRLRVVAIPGFQGDAAQLARLYAGQREQQLKLPSTGSVKEEVLPSGILAVRFGYTGWGPDGDYVTGIVTTAVDASGNAVVFDAFGPEQDLTGASGEITAMIDAAAIG